MRSKLYLVLVFHILLLLFQLSFRQLIVDTTFVRDFGLFLMCFIFFGGQRERIKEKDTLTTLVKIYLLYGIIMSLFHIVDGEGVLNTIVEYRNHFFPFILFFIAVYLLRDVKYRKKWVDFLFVVFIILLVDVYVEALMDMAGISRGVLPWYQYQFTHYYRFTDTDAGAKIVVNPEKSPILGLLGWNNPTSCAITALFSFFLPFLLRPGIKKSAEMPKVACLSSFSKVLLFILTIGALAIIRFRTSVKDPVDMLYLLWSVFIGIICGCQLFEVGVLTSLIVTIVLVVLLLV